MKGLYVDSQFHPESTFLHRDSTKRNENIEIEKFLSLPFTEEAVDVVSQNIFELQKSLGKRVAMENIAYRFVWPGQEFTESEFVKRVLETADCGMLIDVTNLYVNSKNLQYDPYEFLEGLPKDRMMQLHLSGYTIWNGIYENTHVSGIQREILDLAEWVLRHTDCQSMVIERDDHFTSFADLLADLEICKQLYAKCGQIVS